MKHRGGKHIPVLLIFSGRFLLYDDQCQYAEG